MQIVIDIPDKTYEKIVENEYDYGDMNVIIQNGTPLPKGHGRLIDESKIEQIFFHKEESFYKNLKYERVIIDYTDAPTIVEADKEEK